MATAPHHRTPGPRHPPEAYLARELSWLAFDRRVLEEAEDPGNRLLERAKFLAITCSNLDEFVMVRVAELCEAVEGGDKEAQRLLPQVRAEVARLQAAIWTCWREAVAPALEQAGFRVVSPAGWDEVDRETLRRYFLDQLEPVLTPLAVDPARPFPLVANRGITVALRLEPEEGGGERNALVVVPGGRRLVSLVGKPGSWALVEDVVAAHCHRLFPGYRITNRCSFRPTRDGSLDIDEQDAEDLLSEIEQELASRERGEVVRLELTAGADPELVRWLIEVNRLVDDAVVVVDGPLDLTFLFGVGDRMGDRPELRDPPLALAPPPDGWEDPFSRLRQGELLLHHPFEPFQPVVDLVEAAANDPQVLAIKMTLYRTSGDSPIVKALARAARGGKQVTVLVELKARFDEAANIRWARRMEEAGVHVIYGLVGLKVHAKLLLIIRRDEDGIRRYCHLGTGNYNERTARLYTDLSYLTANEAVGRDLAAVFNLLTGYSAQPVLERFALAPLTLRSRCVEWIRREAALGKRGCIQAKFNSLVDHAMCDELYAASQAGVQIDLVVRGMCILRPGVPGLSENIRVRSIVGRLLEHSRIYYFGNDGDPVWAISSADWMTRNLDWRVESLVMVRDPSLQSRLRRILDLCLEDDCQARVMAGDGSYRRLAPVAGKGRAAQVLLVEEAAQSRRPRSESGHGSGLVFAPIRRKT